MRITLFTIIILLGAHFGIMYVDHLKDIQDQRMSELCKIDPSLSTCK